MTGVKACEPEILKTCGSMTSPGFQGFRFPGFQFFSPPFARSPCRLKMTEYRGQGHQEKSPKEEE